MAYIISGKEIIDPSSQITQSQSISLMKTFSPKSFSKKSYDKRAIVETIQHLFCSYNNDFLSQTKPKSSISWSFVATKRPNQSEYVLGLADANSFAITSAAWFVGVKTKTLHLSSSLICFDIISCAK